jgi:very-short-patch-repair endonuclease
MSDAERVLWMLLRGRRFAGWKFRRQAPCGDYVVDFFCPSARLVVELDGAQHGAPEQAAFDAARTADLEAVGLRVVRVWVGDLFHEREGALEAIWQALNHQ